MKQAKDRLAAFRRKRWYLIEGKLGCLVYSAGLKVSFSSQAIEHMKKLTQLLATQNEQLTNHSLKSFKFSIAISTVVILLMGTDLIASRATASRILGFFKSHAGKLKFLLMLAFFALTIK